MERNDFITHDALNYWCKHQVGSSIMSDANELRMIFTFIFITGFIVLLEYNAAELHWCKTITHFFIAQTETCHTKPYNTILNQLWGMPFLCLIFVVLYTDCNKSLQALELP